MHDVAVSSTGMPARNGAAVNAIGPNVIGLCAGSGGLDLAVRLAVPEARGICYVEREASAAASLVASMEAGRLHPAPVWSDLATFDAKLWRGVVDIVTSGDPCQPNSVAGNRAGADDERFLANQVLRIVSECRPIRLFRENVTGNAGGQLAAFIGALEAMGYRVAVGIFSAFETGNSNRRERLFIMADLQDGARRLHPRSRRSGKAKVVSGGQGRGLADTIGPIKEGRQSASGETQSGRAHNQYRGSGRALDDTERTQWRPLDGSCRDDGADSDAQRQESADRAGIAGEAMADAVVSGLRRKSNDSQQAKSIDQSVSQFSPIIIPGPNDNRWPELLAVRPDITPALSQEEAQSLIRRGIDAVANRVERLRHCGNGVDPVAGAVAFLYLDALHREATSAEGIV